MRLLDPSKLKASDAHGPFAMLNGKVGEEISTADAEAIAKGLGFKELPSFPWPPVAAQPA